MTEMRSSRATTLAIGSVVVALVVLVLKAVAWWLRDLSKHDAEPVRKFLAEHGAAMKAFARKEAAQYLPD